MIDLLRKRRSIRKYQPREIEPEKIELLKEALLRAPSSKSSDPWEFIFVDDEGLLSQLSQAKTHGSGFIKNAALGIVVCGDERKSDVWVEDCSIACILVQMTALSLGLGSCWIQIRLREHQPNQTAEEYIQELLGIPEHIRVQAIISLGYPAEEKAPVPKEQLKINRIRRNRFGQIG